MGKVALNIIFMIKIFAFLAIITIFCPDVYGENLLFVGNPQRGQELSATCAACHGPDGNSIQPENPKLAGQVQTYFIEQMLAFKQGQQGPRHNEVMQSITAGLTNQQIYDLAAYYARLPIKTGFANPSYVKLGQQIYQGGIREKRIPACSACHGPNGGGNAPAKFAAIGGQHANYIISQLVAFKKGARRTDKNKMMREVAANLTNEQMQAVASYIEGLY